MATTTGTSPNICPAICPAVSADRSAVVPDPVNEISAWLVAGGVVLLSLAAIALASPWLIVAIAYGFVARALAGPTLSPLGQLVTSFQTN